MSDASEEKSLPASDKKLRDARDKGQVAKSKDLVTGFGLLAGVLYLAYAAAGARDRIEALFLLVTHRIHVDPFDEVWPVVVRAAFETVLSLIVPLLAVMLGAIVLASVISMKGVVFSVTPVIPDFKRVNPGEGFKRIFSLRSVVELVKSLVKIVALGTAFCIVIRSELPDLMRSSTCGASCQIATLLAMTRPLVATAVIVFLVVGLADHFIQKWMFGRDMKMTKSEVKRERRDSEGDPTILRRRKELRQETGKHGARGGAQAATLMIGAPGCWTVGIRYVRGETPAPVVVSRSAPEEASALLDLAVAAGTVIRRDDALSTLIARAARAGEVVPQKSFQQVADLLVSAGLI